MTALYPLYVDEISHDKIKATVFSRKSMYYNLRVMMLHMPFTARLNHTDLRDRFMEVYIDIINHPKNHSKFELALGEPGNTADWRKS